MPKTACVRKGISTEGDRPIFTLLDRLAHWASKDVGGGGTSGTRAGTLILQANGQTKRSFPAEEIPSIINQADQFPHKREGNGVLAVARNRAADPRGVGTQRRDGLRRLSCQVLPPPFRVTAADLTGRSIQIRQGGFAADAGKTAAGCELLRASPLNNTLGWGGGRGKRSPSSNSRLWEAGRRRTKKVAEWTGQVWPSVKVKRPGGYAASRRSPAPDLGP